MSRYIIERRCGRCNRDWLCELTEHATVWSGAGSAMAFGSKSAAYRALAAVERLMALCPCGPWFMIAVIQDRRTQPSVMASVEAEPRRRVGSWPVSNAASARMPVRTSR